MSETLTIVTVVKFYLGIFLGFGLGWAAMFGRRLWNP